MFGTNVVTQKEGKKRHEFMVLKLKVVGDKSKKNKKKSNELIEAKIVMKF